MITVPFLWGLPRAHRLLSPLGPHGAPRVPPAKQAGAAAAHSWLGSIHRSRCVPNQRSQDCPPAPQTNPLSSPLRPKVLEFANLQEVFGKQPPYFPRGGSTKCSGLKGRNTFFFSTLLSKIGSQSQEIKENKEPQGRGWYLGAEIWFCSSGEVNVEVAHLLPWG